MNDQEVIATPPQPHPISPNHKADGDFAAGNKANPTGENGQKGYARFDIRVNYWLDMPDDLIAQKVQDAGGIERLSQRDQICIGMIMAGKTAAPKDKVKIFKELADRTEGPVKQVIQMQGDPDRPLYPATTKDIHEASTSYRDSVNRA